MISSTLRPLTFELYRHRKFPTDADIQRAAKNTTSIYTQNNNARLGKRPGQCPAKYCKYCLIDYIRFLLLMIRILNHICYYLNMYNQPPIKTFSQEGVPCTGNDAQTGICNHLQYQDMNSLTMHLKDSLELSRGVFIPIILAVLNNIMTGLYYFLFQFRTFILKLNIPSCRGMLF